MDTRVKGGFYRMEGGRDWEHEAGTGCAAEQSLELESRTVAGRDRGEDCPSNARATRSLAVRVEILNPPQSAAYHRKGGVTSQGVGQEGGAMSSIP